MRRILLRTLFGVIALVLSFAAFVFARSEFARFKTWRIDEPALAIPTDAAAIARGEHVATTRGCRNCHESELGGGVVMEAPVIGRMAAPNLTQGSGGLPKTYGAIDFERAIRHGIKPNGRALLFMPTRDFAGLSDADTAALIAYIQSVPAVDRTIAPSYIGPVGRMLFAFGKLPMLEARLIDQHAAHVPHIEASASAEYGRYLAQTCTGCHGERFSGGPIPGAPPDFPTPANITPDKATGIGAWSKDDFHRVFRAGKKPDGSDINPFMPWKALGAFSDTELDALWLYLQTVPALAKGNR
ncbi:MAG: c-type cytochrome [Rhodanobacteraceae bacterium]